MHRRIVIRLLALAFAADTHAAVAQTLASAAIRDLPFDSAVTMRTLPNGLRYYIRENDKPEGRVELRLIVKAGSLLEDDDQRGLAHFLEHMAFNGTAHFRRQQIVSYLESVGLRLGADLNASTSYEHTSYTLTIPSNGPATLDSAFLILKDWASAITLDSADVADERAIVLSEYRSRLGAGRRIRLQHDSVAFAGSRFLDREPIGIETRIATAGPAELQRFLRDWYRPDLMALVIVGDVDKAAIDSLMRVRFADIPAPSSPRPPPSFTIPPTRQPAVSIVTDAERGTSTIAVLQRYKPKPLSSPERARESWVEELYSQIVNHRLREIGQSSGAPFLSAATDFTGYVGGLRLATIVGAAVRENEMERGLAAALTEVERIAQGGVTADELERAKRGLLSSYEHALAGRAATSSAEYASRYAAHFLDGLPITSIENRAARASAVVPTITDNEIVALARRWRTRENLAVVATLPRKAGVRVPKKQELLAVLDSVGRVRQSVYAEGVVATSLIDDNPTPGTIVRERLVANVGVTEWILSNGVRVLIKPTDFNPDEVLLSASSLGGTSLVSDSDLASAVAASHLPTISGLGPFASTTLQRVLAGKRVNVSARIGTYTEGLAGSSSVRDLETMLQLVYLHFTALRVDSSAVRAWQQRTRVALDARQYSPEAHFDDSLATILAERHARATTLRAPQIDSISVERAAAIYRDRFADPSGFSFVLVGKIDLDSIRPLVARYLGGLPAVSRNELWRDVGIRPPEGVSQISFPMGTEQRSRTSIVLHGRVADDVANPFALSAVVQVLTRRLREQIRERLGATYSIGVAQSIRAIPDTGYTLSISFETLPVRTDEVIRAVFAEIARLKVEGPLSYEVRDAQTAMLRASEVAEKDNRFWLSRIADYVQMERPLDELGWYHTPLKSMTVEQVHDAARWYLNTERYVRVTRVPKP